jgi:hypothetical protein
VDRRFAWLGGAVGAFAVWKWFRRAGAAASSAEPPDPAEALRRKLEESRVVVEEEREAPDEHETTVDAAPDPDARRHDVHAAARARLDELKRSGADGGPDA